ncbi:MAG: pyridoxamine 5'-phosphate oxidase family protein [Dehalococcoidia bacterium]|uniref:pyridoxamine 5'-phosphate oxidase family protein n=1 Tax=Candidatus Amarobacter glycogenicus TaxID=3140699 RepID=UPI0031346A15|nr:pyridoxamine 5'-phosphate oxidase family protein [Dehalococcoidia bacterium]
MIGTPEQDGFISRSMTGIVATVRRDGRPASSMVGIARHGDSLLFSTVASRVKGRTIARDPRCVVTIIHDNEPGSFVSVEGSVVAYLDNPVLLRHAMYAYWDRVCAIHPRSNWARRGREATELLFSEAGRAVYEVTPTRKSGVLLDRPVLLED